MAGPAASRQRANDLWAEAAAKINKEDRRNINFSRDDKLHILEELHAEAEKARQKSLEKRWKYTRKSGETVILRDVFAKIVRCVDAFKQIGDVAVQYDPGHASLPWAAVRFILMIAVKDDHGYGTFMEGLAEAAELICRYGCIEALYSRSTSTYTKDVDASIVKVYAHILRYLSRAKNISKQEQLVKRAMKSVIAAEPDSLLTTVRLDEKSVKHWMNMIGFSESSLQAPELRQLRQLLEGMDMPIKRMDDSLKIIKDNLEASRRTKIVEWLSRERNEDHHLDSKREVLTGTGQWLLNDGTFKHWKNESASTILWLNGSAGTGKSKLVSIVIDDAEQGFRQSQGPKPIYFYCSRNPAEPARSDPRAILASLVKQLSCSPDGKALSQHTIKAYEHKERNGFASNQLHIDESCQLIKDLINEQIQTTIFIDALDECDPATRSKLLDVLERILRESFSLVKMFISSRQDQDIVLRLVSYPNLEIRSDRNGEDIARFVVEEVDRLVRTKQLLRNSTDKTVMRKMIEKIVTEGAGSMFRWASMQLQNLCSSIDADIKDKLNQNPPELNQLYAKVYDKVSTQPDKQKRALFKNALSWLLCAQASMRTAEFLAAISIDLEGSLDLYRASEETILDICNNFIVHDRQLDTFHFAHLSVREFLEQRAEYNLERLHGLAARVCLQNVGLERDVPTADTIPGEIWLHKSSPAAGVDLFRHYTDYYWPKHIELAGSKRQSGALKEALTRFLLESDRNNSVARLWLKRYQHYSCYEYDEIWQRKLRTVRDRCERSNAPIALVLACVFDFGEFLQAILGEEHCMFTYMDFVVRSTVWSVRSILLRKSLRVSPRYPQLLELAAQFGYCGTFAWLMSRTAGMTTVPQKVLEIAITEYGTGNEVLAWLLNHPRLRIQITPQSLVAAMRHSPDLLSMLLHHPGVDLRLTTDVLLTVACSFYRKVETFDLLLNDPRAEVLITEDVIRQLLDQVRRGDGMRYQSESVMTMLLSHPTPSCENAQGVTVLMLEHFGEEVMNLFLDRCGDIVTVTERVLKAAATNQKYGATIIARLLEWPSVQLLITEEILKAAVDNRKCGASVVAQLLKWPSVHFMITEEILKAAATNQECGGTIVEQLLTWPSAQLLITEEILKAAAGNKKYGAAIIARLLKCPAVKLMITEDVLFRAASNMTCGGAIIVMLLKARKALASATESTATTSGRPFGQDAITLYLTQKGAHPDISEQVIKVLMGSPEAKAIMTLLLERREREVIDACPKDSRGGGFYMERLSPRLVRIITSEGWLYHKVVETTV